jgi:hypothetical protein
LRDKEVNEENVSEKSLVEQHKDKLAQQKSKGKKKNQEVQEKSKEEKIREVCLHLFESRKCYHHHRRWRKRD